MVSPLLSTAAVAVSAAFASPIAAAPDVSGEDPVTLNEGDIVVGNWKSYHTLFKEGLIDLL